MNGHHVAIRYATALYEVALEKDALTSVSEDMASLHRLMTEVPQIRHYCLKTHPSHAQESLFIETAFLPYVSAITGNMIAAAVHNGRLDMLPLIPQAFANLQNQRSGITSVLLETAHAPLEGVLDLITKKMQRKIGNNIQLEHRINPDLIGGFKVWYEGHLIDNSVAGRLTRLQRLLKTI